MLSQRYLSQQVDGASLGFFRILLGIVMMTSHLRLLLSGWLSKLYDEPTFFFHYIESVTPPTLSVVYATHAALLVLAAAVTVGFKYRPAIVVYAVLFCWSQLWDVTNYLNHYYLVALLSGLLCFIPAHRNYSFDASRHKLPTTVPRYCLLLIRFQIACVYFYAGLAKLNTDWLLHAQPLNIWLTARSEMPLIGPLMDERWFAFACSWGGFLFDSTIVFWLSLKKTRALAYAVVIIFHFYTWLLFDIGMFPFIMMASATIFFAADWPRKFRSGKVSVSAASVVGRKGLAAILCYCGFQIVFPLRHYLYPGDVLWNEDGMRYSWKVMVREKHGSVNYKLVSSKTRNKAVEISPRKYLTMRQEREMSGQPDLILQLAHKIREDYKSQGHRNVKIYCDAWISLNGRRRQRLIDPTVNLAKLDETLGPSTFVTNKPKVSPIHLEATK